MSVDYKTQREVDREEYVAGLKEHTEVFLREYYNGILSISFVLDELEILGLSNKERKNVEAQLLGNNTSSDDMIDYIVDRMDLEPITE